MERIFDQWEKQENQTPEQRAHFFGRHQPTTEEYKPAGTVGVGTGPQVESTTGKIEVKCGPLLNYKHMSGDTWYGSVLLVTTPGQYQPELRLRCLEPTDASSRASSKDFDDAPSVRPRIFHGEKLYSDPKKAFWRFRINLMLQQFDAKWEYHIPNTSHLSGASAPYAATKVFAVPSIGHSMRIMFHSCNGFSVGTDEDAWSGTALWNDVLRMHAQQPFHVMIGGGDQIYNDGVRITGPLRPWTNIANPKKRKEYPFNEEMRKKCDDYYFENYTRWYSSEPFASANGQIPQINIWDDHDIIDGFGSYTDHFMKCSVFRGIGGVAHKYYLLFQHHVPPPRSTYSTDAPNALSAGPDKTQLDDTFVMAGDKEDPSFIIGKRPGPYVEEASRNIYTRLGASVAFVGIDARTERTRHQVNYPDTYELIFDRVSSELKAAGSQIKHLILLLGVPIAYPRLQWLENILSSPLIGVLRLLSKRFGIAGEVFNNFDGNPDLLDDLDDHYTAHQHKKERKNLMLRLQTLSKTHNVRISIVSGDVHLAALGRFYSNPKLNIPAEQDHRYMPNIISSAITNKPPPSAVANLLARRNKIHHLDHDTDETLLNFFNHDPGLGPQQDEQTSKKIGNKTASSNHCTMPSRNYAIISESSLGDGTSESVNGHAAEPAADQRRNSNGREALHSGEENAGTTHPAASGLKRTGLGGSHGLDVSIRVEINPSDREGRTEGYGLTIPALELGGK